jgi:glycosyltransferase involved in cell wall biosynthesis
MVQPNASGSLLPSASEPQGSPGDRERAQALETAEKSALANVPRVIVTSRWTQQRLAAFGVERKRITVIEPGTDRRDSIARTAATSTLRLLTVATVTPRKGHRILIEALSNLKDLDWTLRCAGSLELDRRCAQALAEQINAAGLTDRVSLLGELSPETISNEYAAADLFVLPSFLEGYGMALAEAIAHAVPVVSTTAGAIPDTVPTAAGVLVPPGDADALSAALRRLLSDTALAERLARTAYAEAPLYSWAARAAALHELLREVA